MSFNHNYICTFFFFSMALEPFGPWLLFQFLNPIDSQQDSLERGSAHRKAATYTQNNTNTEWTHTDIHASSGIRTHGPVFERVKMVHNSDIAPTVIGYIVYVLPLLLNILWYYLSVFHKNMSACFYLSSQSSGIWQHVFWQIDTNFSEEAFL
jgi:hypothetical protein